MLGSFVSRVREKCKIRTSAHRISMMLGLEMVLTPTNSLIPCLGNGLTLPRRWTIFVRPFRITRPLNRWGRTTNKYAY